MKEKIYTNDGTNNAVIKNPSFRELADGLLNSKQYKKFGEALEKVGWTEDIILLYGIATSLEIHPDRLIWFLSIKNGYRYYNTETFLNDLIFPFFIKDDLIKIIKGEYKLPMFI